MIGAVIVIDVVAVMLLRLLVAVTMAAKAPVMPSVCAIGLPVPEADPPPKFHVQTTLLANFALPIDNRDAFRVCIDASANISSRKC